MKKILIFTLGLFFLTISAYAQNGEMDPEAGKLFNDGNKAMKSGDYTTALNNYNNALKKAKDYRIFYQKGVVLKKLNKLNEAVEAYEESVKDNPKFDLAYNGLGGVYFSQGKYAEAAESFKKFAELTTQANYKKRANEYIARALTKLGDVAKNDGNPEKAVSLFKEAISYHQYDAAYVSLAITYNSLAKYDEAINHANKVIDMKSSKLKGAAYYYKGLAFKAKDDKAQAKTNFELAKRDPEYKKNSQYELDQLK